MMDIVIKFTTTDILEVLKTFIGRINAKKNMDGKGFYVEAFKLHYYLLIKYPTWSRIELLNSCLSI